MINPADNRAHYFYTPNEVHAARYILKNQGRDRYGNLLYPETWYKWAAKVSTWYGRFLQVLRRYARALRSVALAQVAIWKNLKSGYSVPRMLRDETSQAQEHRTAPARWINNPHIDRDDRARNGSPITATNPKTNKHSRRAQVIRITHTLQTAANV